MIYSSLPSPRIYPCIRPIVIEAVAQFVSMNQIVNHRWPVDVHIDELVRYSSLQAPPPRVSRNEITSSLAKICFLSVATSPNEALSANSAFLSLSTRKSRTASAF